MQKSSSGNMLILLCGIVFLHIAVLVLLFVSTIVNVSICLLDVIVLIIMNMFFFFKKKTKLSTEGLYVYLHRPGLLVLPVAQTSGKTAPQSACRAARSVKLEVGNNGFIIEIMHRLMLGYRNAAEFARGALRAGTRY